MAITLDWIIKSNNTSMSNVIPEDFTFTYDLVNDSIKKSLRYGERDNGINLVWGNEETGDNIRFRRQSGSNDLLRFEESIAINVNNGGWLKYGERDEGINLVWSNVPVFEWTIKGLNAEAITTNQVVGLFNQKVSDTLEYGERDNGINLVWTSD